MKKLIVVGTSAVAAAGASLALFGAGIASADDYAGQSYADASSAAGDAGQTVVIASRVGSLSDDDCTVTRSQSAPFIEGSDFITHVSGTVQFYLNCTAGLAGAGVAGNSLASPEGQAAKAAADEAAAEAAAQQNESDELLDAGAEPGATTPDIATG
ncbi:hypothetical protein BH09ACT7_BH09ACT7_03590 [soil metagenome]